MFLLSSRLWLVPLFLGGLAPFLNAAEPSAAEARLRETLRATLLQVRTLQGERDTLQAEKAQLEQEKQALTKQVEAASRQSATDREAAAQKVAALEGQSARQVEGLTRLQEALEKWKLSQQQAAALAEKRETERTKAVQRGTELQRRVDAQQNKNFAMYQVALEILDRYQHFGLGTALTAREPFVGTTRVKLENLVQEFRDKLQEQRVRAQEARPAAQSAPADQPTAPKKG